LVASVFHFRFFLGQDPFPFFTPLARSTNPQERSINRSLSRTQEGVRHRPRPRVSVAPPTLDRQARFDHPLQRSIAESPGFLEPSTTLSGSRSRAVHHRAAANR